ncbi:hypothetical protein FBU59_005388 [Linderina macrospora]|uniref:Uncharacterized protein n=1 Tax=Linderina macrospora TaxID=4868 RepID=A0ACC1J2V1_9FUNG|nr:hypothetical protein FBU59_005388 [Linderina macrospora]
MNTKIVVAALLPLAFAQNAEFNQRQGILDGIVSAVGNGVNHLTSNAVELFSDVANGAASVASRVQSDFNAGKGKTSATPTPTPSASATGSATSSPTATATSSGASSRVTSGTANSSPNGSGKLTAGVAAAVAVAAVAQLF